MEVEIQQADASTKNENLNEQWENFLGETFTNLKPPSFECLINRVPHHLRNWNNEAYTPQVISIGPIHYDKKKFQTIKKYKVRYFKSFMQWVHQNGKKLEDLVSTIRKMEDRIRRCYVEIVMLGSEDFVKMIMLDASFILVLILRKIDHSVRMEGWVMDVVLRDLILLENQLPFFVIETLYLHALPSHSNSPPLIQLTYEFFKDFFKDLNIHNKCPDVDIQHFTDLLRFFQLPPTNKLPERVKPAIFPKYSVTQLHEAGVKFNVASSKCAQDEVALSIRDEKPSSKCVVLDEEASTKCLLDEVASSVRDEVQDDPSRRILDLSFENRVLEIPHLVFNDNTEVFVRNIMALEQRDYTGKAYVTDFYSILDGLINTDKDVELLIENKILVNELGDNKAVAYMINRLNRGIFYKKMIPKFHKLSDDLNKHYEEGCHIWMAMLKQQYFSNPWRSTATVAATILLVLTLIIAVTSILLVVP